MAATPPDGPGQHGELVVLLSSGPPRTETNPYLVQLAASLPDDVAVRWFSWRVALLGRFDVLHLHWPEVKLRGSSRSRDAVRAVLFLLLLLRLRGRRKGIVRTLHNVRPHERLAWYQRSLLGLCDRWTTRWITLSDHVRPPTGAAATTVPHGHYRDWYPSVTCARPVPGRLLFIGLVRRYKGVTELLECFREIDDTQLSLRVVGKHTDDSLRAEVGRLAADDPRVTVVDRYVDDATAAAEMASCEVVVLPYAEMTNSGALLMALSLDRPVVVPAAPVTEEIAREVGPGWISTFDAPLTPGKLQTAVATAKSSRRTSRPDLTAREWTTIGRDHAAVYRAAVAGVGRRKDER